jgi:translation initiation factor 2B subunit (eIF-2B alpha/beta/delta family)
MNSAAMRGRAERAGALTKGNTLFESIASDSTSSASVLTRLAARELAEIVEASSATESGAFWEELHGACRELVAAKREMASIISLVSQVLNVAERSVLSGVSPDTARRIVYGECSRIWDSSETMLEEVGLEGAGLVPADGTVATVSTSESVRAVLAAAVRAGTECRVIISESRPSNEGVEFGTSLPAWGIPVTLVVDAALPRMIERCQLALVGADSISENDFVNKTGTYALAVAAREAGVPFYVTASTDKFIAEGARGRPDRVWDPGEVLSSPQPGVTVENRYFERVPLSLVEGIVTEEGILGPDEVAAKIAARPVSPALLEILFPRAVEASQ